MSFRSKGFGRTILPFGLDYSDVLTTSFDVEKPKLILPVNAPLSAAEKDQAIQAINLTKLVLDGPFYTGNSVDSQQQVTPTTHPDGIERHSDKYKKVKKIGSTIEDHPYNLEFFPQELYSVMGVSKKKKIGLSSYKAAHEIHSDVKAPSPISEDKSKLVLEQLKDMAVDLDTKEDDINGDDMDPDDDEDDDNIEDEFEDDEDDDYNAEKYFDDGNDDFADNGEDEAAF
ncbi:DNA-directed RNA polymerase III subunit C31 [Yamadazyma tenuis]|uniref:DNA-directed RNA polymerase III subunit C31 n=1 Tax=Candida tenuis TaxID=2315449 RepID=UPI002799C226|nr:DNA-directed RNA polymerase III subunit C31 [Yamadazyma tenuis]